MMCLFLFEIIGLVFEVLGSLFLLVETIRFRFDDEHLEVCVDKKDYRMRLRMRKVGITLLLIGFLLQLIGAIARIRT